MFKLLMWKALRRGATQKNKPWMIVGVLLSAFKVIRFLGGRGNDSLVYSEKLKAGQSLVISNTRSKS